MVRRETLVEQRRSTAEWPMEEGMRATGTTPEPCSGCRLIGFMATRPAGAGMVPKPMRSLLAAVCDAGETKDGARGCSAGLRLGLGGADPTEKGKGAEGVKGGA